MDNIRRWLKTTRYKEFEITIASADASFRKYYRLTKGSETFILMDSSLELNSLTPFIQVSKKLLNAKVKVPKILAQNLKDGYLVLEDFGDTLLLDVLNKNNFKILYIKAIDEIIKMQNANSNNLPLYNKAFLHTEMDLMKEWYLQKNLALSLSENEINIINSSLDNISNIVLQQPQNTFVHRDFHSRNIMLIARNSIGIIDYQDAMSGAITYDLVSLLKDCYIEYNREDIEKLALIFRNKKALKINDKEFIKWFDFMGLQRHIKVLGIFSRLLIRDAKDEYIKDIPLTLKYVIDTANRYHETKELAKFLQRVTS